MSCCSADEGRGAHAFHPFQLDLGIVVDRNAGDGIEDFAPTFPHMLSDSDSARRFCLRRGKIVLYISGVYVVFIAILVFLARFLEIEFCRCSRIYYKAIIWIPFFLIASSQPTINKGFFWMSCIGDLVPAVKYIFV